MRMKTTIVRVSCCRQ